MGMEHLRPLLAGRLRLTRDCRTNSAGEHLFVVDITLYPTHQVLDVFGRRHFGWSLEVLTVLPKVFESGKC